jgi:hypothetical protein
MGEEIQAVCDRCRKRQPFSCARTAVSFLRRHRHCNFTGCRVVRVDNPCPNRARDYTLEDKDVVRPGFYAEIA